VNEDLLSLVISSGTIVAALIGALSVRAGLRDLRRAVDDARNKPKPSHVSVDVKYSNGKRDHLEVEPHNPLAAEEALRELRSA